MSKTRKLCYLGMLTALYVMLSAFLKVTFIGNIQLDLGYIAYAVALYMFGWAGIAVGVIGCSLESILFSAYGFSVSWAVANLILGALWCFTMHSMSLATDGFRVFSAIMMVLCVGMGMILVKTTIECALYGIPWKVKVVKNVVATIADSITMLIGAGIWFGALMKRVRA